MVLKHQFWSLIIDYNIWIKGQINTNIDANEFLLNWLGILIDKDKQEFIGESCKLGVDYKFEQTFKGKLYLYKIVNDWGY